jgi:hypothetical protein
MSAPVVTEEVMYSSASEGLAKSKWWLDDVEGSGTRAHVGICAAVTAIDAEESSRDSMLEEYIALYSNELDPVTLRSRASDTRRSVARRVTYNVVKSCANTATAKIAKNRPRPLFLTSGADFEMQERAEKLTKYIDGTFTATDIYQVGQRVFKDACITGTGAMRILEKRGQVAVERVLVGELRVDPIEALHGTPKTLYQVRVVAKDVLMSMCKDDPAKQHAILMAPCAQSVSRNPSRTVDMVEVIEAWHLPDEDGNGGAHAIAIEDLTLVFEPYTKDYFPFVFFRWEDPIEGFWGTGLAEELAGIQAEINKLLRNIQLSQKLAAGLRIAIEKGSQINPKSITNEIGSVIEYVGTPPTPLIWNAMSAEVYAHLERLYQRAYEITGISMLSAQSKKPAGLDSGVALREFQDIESERFVLVGQRWESFFLQATRIIVDISKDLFKKNKKLSVKVKNIRFVETVPWKDVDMDEDKYEMTVFPTSALPTTPAGRLQTITEMMANGLLSQEEGKSLLEFPDLQSTMQQVTAPYRVIQKLVGHFLKGGKFVGPEPFMDLEGAKKTMQYAYLWAKTEDYPEERLKNMILFMESCDDMIKEAKMQAEQAAMEAQAAAAGPPPGEAPAPDPGGLPPGSEELAGAGAPMPMA